MNSISISRRHLLKLGAAGAAVFFAGRGSSMHAAAAELHPLGAVTGAIKKQLDEDWRGTLERVAKIGFTELEFSDPLGPSPVEAKKALDDFGLKALAGGGALHDLRLRLPLMIDQWQAQGKTFLACYWPWLDSGKNKTLEDYRALAGILNDLGKKTKAGGLRFVFHHHDIEFIKTDGRVPYELLLAETDPELVSTELDVYWLAKAGADPVYYLEKYGPRIAILHLGDMNKSGDKSIVCPGEGTLDFRPALAAAVTAGVTHVMVENPSATTGLDCLSGAYRHVRALPF